MGKFTLTDDAKEDLKDVKTASNDKFGPALTKVYLEGMRAAMSMLAEHMVGTDASEETWPGVFFWPYESHYIFFLRIEAGIQVVGILHQSRLSKALQKRKP
ncbi:type II toxin-antitoxin system RelE/ParE family toxin [Erwinia sp. E_sp_B04_7]|uniref:type II toxin-antitoxin system RelE/ParE family toxin n=1 Tax=unclassified Erwinia TaxID=2622719 RepID=UPI0030D16D2A